jgi:WD40 repeat protein
MVTLHAEGKLRVWDVPTAMELWSHRVPALSSRPGVQPPVGPVVCLPDNSGFVVGTTDGRVVQVNWAAAETAAETKAIDAECTALAVSPDSRRLAAGGKQTLAVFDRTAGGWRRRAVYPFAVQPGLTAALEFAPDGRHLAAGSTDGAVFLFRMPPAGPDSK